MTLPPRFRDFVAPVLAAFLFTWLLLIVVPWCELGHLPPVVDTSGPTPVSTPGDKSNEAHVGERIYAANGCVYCHTQEVRADTSGADLVRGWGTAHDDDTNKDITRRTYPRDYLWNHQVFLGTSREGADLTNVAQRYPDAAKLYCYLYDPRLPDYHTSMPAYRFLFIKRRIDGQPSQDALVLPRYDAPPAGFEIVPTPEARALVAYLLSLKNDYSLPEEKGPIPPPAPAATKS
jgi:cytochrome c oxidase cbb3-type subunit 2